MKARNDQHPPDETLSARLDGELTKRRQQAIDTHLADCVSCRQRYEQLADLRQGIQRLGGVQAPERIWQAIRPAAPVRQSRRVTWWMLPAAAALAAALAWLGFSWLGHPPAPGGNGQEASPRAALQAVQQAEIEYVRAIDTLAAAWRGNTKFHDPGLRREVEQSLAVIDGAVKKLRRQLRDRPRDIESRQQLLALYQRKVDLLSELVLAGDE